MSTALPQLSGTRDERGDLDPEFAPFLLFLGGAHDNVGITLTATGKLDEAIEAFRAALTN